MDPQDIVAIHQLMSLYGHYMDQAQSDLYLAIGRKIEFEEVFTADIEFRFGAQSLSGKSGIEAMLNRGPDGEEGAVAHGVTNVFVYQADGETRVHAKWFVPDRTTGATPAGWRLASVDARVRSFPGGVPEIRTE
jgi:hypothetical protein